jgi:hypothetical protein
MLRTGRSILTFSPFARAGSGQFDQLIVEGLAKTMVLLFALEHRCPRPVLRALEDTAVVEPRRFPMTDALLHVEQIAAADQVVEAANAHLRHQFANLFGDEEEVVDHVLGLAREPAAKHRILSRDPHRAGVEMALAHHDAALDNQRRRRETELVGAEQARRSGRRARS